MRLYRDTIRCFWIPNDQPVALYFDFDESRWRIDCPNEGACSLCPNCLAYHTPRLIDRHAKEFPPDFRPDRETEGESPRP